MSEQEHLDQAHVHFACEECEQHFSSNQALKEHQSTNCTGLFQKCELGSTCSEEWVKILNINFCIILFFD